MGRDIFQNCETAIKYDYNKVTVFRFSNVILGSAVKRCAIFNLKLYIKHS